MSIKILKLLLTKYNRDFLNTVNLELSNEYLFDSSNIDDIRYAIINGDKICYDSEHYSRPTDNMDSIKCNEDLYYCDYYDEYFTETFCVNIGGSVYNYSQKAIDSEGLSYYDGEYYNDGGLSYHNLAFAEDTEEILPTHDLYFHESDCRYYTYEEEDEGDDENYTRSYHNNNSHTVSLSKNSTYKVGFEIEKEDDNILTCMTIGEFEDSCPDWRKERDSSLDNNGYELISPIYPLIPDEIITLIKENDVLSKHINADYSDNCGGHINVSETGLSGRDLFYKVNGYFHLLYAMYPQRANNSYSQAKSKRGLLEDDEKRQAVRIHYDRIELRIFPTVRDIRQLDFRLKLVELIVNNPTDDEQVALNNLRTIFKPLFFERIYTEESFKDLIRRFKNSVLKFENIEII